MDALLIVDAQNDFMPRGALPVPKGDNIVPTINGISDLFPLRIWTKDWHPADHCSFKENGGEWPTHCVESTPGAEIHSALQVDVKDVIWQKGERTEVDAYSAFKDANNKPSGLITFLRDNGVKHLYVCGLATEYCVKSNVLHALEAKFKVTVVFDGIKGLDNEGSEAAIEEMKAAGANFIAAADVLDTQINA